MDKMSDVEQRILDAGFEDVIIFGNHGSGDSYDSAFIGISEDGRAIYDFDLMVEWVMEQDGCSADDAIEWIEYNAIRSLPYVGTKAPIIMYRI